MIRFDDAARELRLSVHDLVMLGAPRGRAGRGCWGARSAMEAGQRLHRHYQSERRAEDATFEAERTLTHREVLLGWTVTLHGRVDGLVEEAPGCWVVEEVKTTAMEGDRLLSTGVDDWPAYVEQLRIYLWMVASEGPGRAVSGRLVMVSRTDGSRHLLGVVADRREVGDRVRGRLKALLLARESRLRWWACRRGWTVAWPHRTSRPGQDTLMAELTRGLERGEPVFIQAPTGMGKTVATLVAALRVALQSGRQIFWGTSRNTQQRGVLATAGALCGTGLPLRALVVGSRERTCLREGGIDCRPEVCAAIDGYADRLEAAGGVEVFREPLLDPERLVAIGRCHGFCPYELSRDLIPGTDVVIGDINYIYAPDGRLSIFEREPERWIVVVDEAHQLVERVRASRSPAVSGEAARRLAEHLGVDPEWMPFAQVARRVERMVAEHTRAETGPRRGDEVVVEPRGVGWTELLQAVMALGPLPGEARDEWDDLARSIIAFAERVGTLDAGSVVLARGRAEVRVCCLDPSSWIRRCSESLGGLVALSATLEPARFHVDLWGLAHREPRIVDLPSPFPPERLGVWIAPRVSTAYRDRRAHAPATAALLERCIRAVPGNVAVFFSSFAMMDDLAGRWHLEGRELLLQPRRLSEARREHWLARLGDDGPPVVLGAVLGGIFAEGIDLPPGALSAVLVCGPALPPVGLERDLLRRCYQERYGEGFRYASLVPGMTRVVQAAGRLIRRPEDRGAVVLVGRRFRWRSSMELLPAHWDVEITDEPEGALRAFFEEDV